MMKKKIVLITIGVIGTLASALLTWVAPLLVMMIPVSIRGDELRREAQENKTYLANLTILDDQKTEASAQPDGDGFAGKSAPAEASFIVDTTLNQAYGEIVRNLARQGFTATGKYSTDTELNTVIPSVYVKTTHHKRVLIIQFNFEDPIDCGKTVEECRLKQAPSLQENGFFDNKITGIDVIYDDDRDASGKRYVPTTVE